MWKTAKLTDKPQILSFLETDRLYAAYAIGDLEPAMFAKTTWAGAERDGRMKALALYYTGLKPPALFLMGDANGLRAILEDALCPEWVYLTCRRQHLPMTRDFYELNETIPMWRMVLRPARFRPVEGDCVRLSRAHSSQLAELYALGGGIAFGPAQVEEGAFYGVLADGQLIAAAGTHLVSPAYGVAAVGNIFTHPNHRRRGYGTACTSQVVEELLAQGLDVVLNVNRENTEAIGIYERLGFRRHCPYIEVIGNRK